MLKEKKELRLYESNLLRTFAGINYRCFNEKNIQYMNWWWRWIKCEWEDFESFYQDMLPWYKPWLSIDRIDNDWNYSKENCQWLTRSDNSLKWKKTQGEFYLRKYSNLVFCTLREAKRLKYKNKRFVFKETNIEGIIINMFGR